MFLAGGHSCYGGDVDVRLQRPPIFSAAVTQWPHISGEMWALRSVSPKDPLFFAFGCHRKLLFVSISLTSWSFLPFSTIFFQIPAFKALTERSKVTFSPKAPNFEPKFCLSPNDPSFFEIVFSPAFGSVSLTPVSICYWSGPPGVLAGGN